MTFDWSEFLILAKMLAGQPVVSSNEEAKLRSSVSRAYYAAFCCARNYLRDMKSYPIPNTPDIHKFVKNTFVNSSIREERKIGELLCVFRPQSITDSGIHRSLIPLIIDR